MERIEWIEEYLDEAMRLAYDEGHEPALRLLDKLLFEEPGYGRLHFTLGKVYYKYAEDAVRSERQDDDVTSKQSLSSLLRTLRYLMDARKGMRTTKAQRP